MQQQKPLLRLPVRPHGNLVEINAGLIQVSHMHDARSVKKRKKAEPTPRNAFPHVVEKVVSVLHQSNIRVLTTF